MDADRLSVLHEHYRDSCAGMAEQRGKRDLYFYLIVAILTVVMFDMATPDGFARLVSEVVKTQAGLSSAPDLDFVRSLLWFLLLGLAIRYGQAALAVERLYTYIHSLEESLATHVGAGFEREGAAYKRYNPIFMQWAHYAYTLVFPLVLAVIVIVWLMGQLPGVPWPIGGYIWTRALWFNSVLAVAIIASIVLYLDAFHFYSRRHKAKQARAAKASEPEPDAADSARTEPVPPGKP